MVAASADNKECVLCRAWIHTPQGQGAALGPQCRLLLVPIESKESHHIPSMRCADPMTPTPAAPNAPIQPPLSSRRGTPCDVIYAIWYEYACETDFEACRAHGRPGSELSDHRRVGGRRRRRVIAALSLRAS